MNKQVLSIEQMQEFIICKCQWKDYYDYRIVTSDAKGHVRVSFFADEICISDLYVNESCRRQGIGTKLLDKVDELLNGREATIVPLEDWESEWYKRRGYIVKSDTEQEPINEEELNEKVNYLIDSLAYWEACENEPEAWAEDFKKLLDLAPKHPRVVEYCDYLIKSANAHFKEAIQRITNKKEPISDEELDRLANEHVGNYGCERYDDGVEAYKTGFKKVLEIYENNNI